MLVEEWSSCIYGNFISLLCTDPFTFPASVIAGFVMGEEIAGQISTPLPAKHWQVFFKELPQCIAWLFNCWNASWMNTVHAVPWLVAAGLWQLRGTLINLRAHFLCQRAPQISSQRKSITELGRAAFSPYCSEVWLPEGIPNLLFSRSCKCTANSTGKLPCPGVMLLQTWVMYRLNVGGWCYILLNCSGLF